MHCPRPPQTLHLRSHGTDHVQQTVSKRSVFAGTRPCAREGTGPSQWTYRRRMTSPQPCEPPAQEPAAPVYPQPHPQSYPQAYPQSWPMPVSMPGISGFAVAGFVCSFFSLIGGVLGIVFGAIALSQIKVTGQHGRGLAIAGLAIGGCWLGFFLIAIISAAVTP